MLKKFLIDEVFLKEITLYSGSGSNKLKAAEIEKVKHQELAKFLRGFIIDNNVKECDRVPLMIAFDGLKPTDLTDAFFCANIVYCQQILKELNDYRSMYKKFEMSSKRSSKKYQWALKEYSSLMSTLASMIKSRSQYKGQMQNVE